MEHGMPRSLKMTWPQVRLLAKFLSGSVLFGLSVAFPMLPQASYSWSTPISITVFVSAFIFNALSFMTIARYIHYTMAFCFIVILSSQIFFDHVNIGAQRRFIPSYMMALSFLTASWPSLLQSLGLIHENETPLPRHMSYRPIYTPLVYGHGIYGLGSARSSPDGSMGLLMMADAGHETHSAAVSPIEQPSSLDGRQRRENSSGSEEMPYIETDHGSRRPRPGILEDLDWQQRQPSDSSLSGVTSPPRARLQPWSAQELELAFMHMSRPSSNAQSPVYSRTGSSLSLGSRASREAHGSFSEDSSELFFPRHSQ